MSGLALGVVGLWVILQTTFGPLATKLGLIAGVAGSNSTVQPGGPASAQGGGPSVWQPSSVPPGAPPGHYRVDQNGNYEIQVGGQWVPYSLSSPGYA